MSILVKSATIISPENEKLHRKKRDILISEGTIKKIAVKIDPPKDATLLERDNLHVSLGWFDSGVCFGEPGFEERETIANGLEVAGKSGFTDILLNPNTNPLPDTSSDIVFLKERTKGFATNLHPLGNLTKGSDGKELAELFDMHNKGAVAFYDFKKPITNANLLKIALLYVQNFGGLVFSFPQDDSIKGNGNVHEGEVSTKMGMKGYPALAEELQLARDLFILEYTGGKLHIPTISSAGSVKLIAEAKKKGLDVTCSVALANLIFTDKRLEDFDTRTKIMPPLRDEKNRKTLIKAVKEGTIDYVTSDHTPIDIEQKRVEFDNAEYGTIGLESFFGVAQRIFSLDETVHLLTKGRIRFSLEQPTIKIGAHACLTLFNPEIEWTQTKSEILSTSKNSIFLGAKMQGIVYGIINGNQYHFS